MLTPSNPDHQAAETARRPALFWRLVPWVLIVLGTASVALTQRGIGFTWDEAYYYVPSKMAGEWVAEIFRGNHPFDAATIDKYWEPRHEHPSVGRLLSGVALQLFPDQRPYLAMRLPMALLFGFTLALIFLIGRRCWSSQAGLFAAILYAMLPRVFGHEHFATLEPPLLFMTMLVVYCFLRGLDSPVWAAITGVAWGVLLATKINGFFLPVPLVLWAHLYARPRYVNNLFSMVTLGPIAMVASWPWLWHDTAKRLLNYLMFHTEHQKISVFFMGLMWGDQHTAPWFYPAVIIGVSVPLTILLVFVIGFARSVAAPRQRPYETLCLFCVLVMIGLASVPGIPKYDGERLFLTVFPFLSLLGGAAIGSALDQIGKPAMARLAAAGVALVLLADGGVAISRYHPYLLSYFNPIVGGLPGAARRFEVTYWGEALNDDLIRAINHLPDGSTLKGVAFNDGTMMLLQEWGLIKPTITIGGAARGTYFDYHLVQNRRGMFSRIERTLVDTDMFPMIYAQRKMGVPLMMIYKSGPQFEQAWRKMKFEE